jgi:hypothetical protein
MMYFCFFCFFFVFFVICCCTIFFHLFYPLVFGMLLLAQAQQLEMEKVLHLEGNLSVLRAKLKDDDKQLTQAAERNEHLAKQVAGLSEELRMLGSAQQEEAHNAAHKLRHAERTVEQLQQTVQSLTTSNREVENMAADVAQALRAQVHDLQQQCDNVTHELNALRITHKTGTEKELLHQQERHKQLQQQLQEKHAQELQLLAAQHQQQLLQQQKEAASNGPSAGGGSLSGTPPRLLGSASKYTPDRSTRDGRDGRGGKEAELIAELREKIEDMEVELEDGRGECDRLAEVSSTDVGVGVVGCMVYNRSLG